MAMNLGDIKVKVDVEPSAAVRVLVAATQMHDAIYYLTKDRILELPEQVQCAFGELQRALEATRSDAREPART